MAHLGALWEAVIGERTWYEANFKNDYYDDERHTDEAMDGKGYLAHLLKDAEADVDEQFTSLLVSQLIWPERS